MDRQLIQEYFNLTETELSIYLTLLSVEESSASQIALKNSLNRTFTYDRLQSLIEKGLVSFFIKENKKYFRAADPSELSNLLKQRETEVISEIKKKQKAITQMIPDLKKLKQPSKEKTHVEVYATKKGIRTILNLILKQKEPLYIYGNLELFEKTMDTYFNIWNSHRIKNKIKTKILTTKWHNIQNVELDLISEQDETKSTTFTFSDKHIVVFWQEVPTALMIQNKDIAHDQRLLFENLWQKDIKIYTGWDGIVKSFFDMIKEKNSIIQGYGFSAELAKIYGIKISDEWHSERLKNKVVCNFISYKNKDSLAYFKKRMNKWNNFNIKFLPKELCGPVNVFLSNKMVVTIIYTEKKVRVIVNKNKESVLVYKKYFNKLWRKSR